MERFQQGRLTKRRHRGRLPVKFTVCAREPHVVVAVFNSHILFCEHHDLLSIPPGLIAINSSCDKNGPPLFTQLAQHHLPLFIVSHLGLFVVRKDAAGIQERPLAISHKAVPDSPQPVRVANILLHCMDGMEQFEMRKASTLGNVKAIIHIICVFALQQDGVLIENDFRQRRWGFLWLVGNGLVAWDLLVLQAIVAAARSRDVQSGAWYGWFVVCRSHCSRFDLSWHVGWVSPMRSRVMLGVLIPF